MSSITVEAYGWAAAIMSMLAFGSFGVPIKSAAAQSVNIDPLVFQSYKTTMCFLTSWAVLLVPGQSFSFTMWGIVSGLFWVPAGVATIYAVKATGLAVGIAIGSSFIVLVSFTWGVLIFQEHVKSRAAACIAILLMILGLCGMAYFSSPHNVKATVGDMEDYQAHTSNIGYREVQIERKKFDDAFPADGLESMTHDPSGVVLCGRVLPNRSLGIAAAAFCGLWGGSVMVPMHYAPKANTGISYSISFGIGAALINLSLWVIRFLYHVVRTRSLRMAYNSLPSFHPRVMWRAGGTSGTLWSIGNFFSMVAVDSLGQAVGYSVIQAGMLVSGLWGIFYFHEIVGFRRICNWMLSAMLTIVGIILLSFQHRDDVRVENNDTGTE